MLLNRQQTERRASTYAHANSRYMTLSEMADVNVPLQAPPLPLGIRERRPSIPPPSPPRTSSPDSQPRSRTRQNTRSYSTRPTRDRVIRYDVDVLLAAGRDTAQRTDHEIDTSDRLPDATFHLSRGEPKARIETPRSRILSEARSAMSAGVSWIYRNEFGRFFVDVLSALIRLALILLGFQISSVTPPIFASYTNGNLPGSSRSTNRADEVTSKYETSERTKEYGNTVEHESYDVREGVKHASSKTSSQPNDIQSPDRNLHPSIVQELTAHYRTNDHGR